MGFSEDLRSETKTLQCSVQVLRQEMGGDDMTAFDGAMDDMENVSSNAIERAVKRGGYGAVVGVRSIRKHRAHECVCFGVTS